MQSDAIIALNYNYEKPYEKSPIIIIIIILREHIHWDWFGSSTDFYKIANHNIDIKITKRKISRDDVDNKYVFPLLFIIRVSILTGLKRVNQK